jgi:hypothetical protein
MKTVNDVFPMYIYTGAGEIGVRTRIYADYEPRDAGDALPNAGDTPLPPNAVYFAQYYCIDDPARYLTDIWYTPTKGVWMPKGVTPVETRA